MTRFFIYLTYFLHFLKKYIHRDLSIYYLLYKRFLNYHFVKILLCVLINIVFLNSLCYAQSGGGGGSCVGVAAGHYISCMHDSSNVWCWGNVNGQNYGTISS